MEGLGIDKDLVVAFMAWVDARIDVKIEEAFRRDPCMEVVEEDAARRKLEDVLGLPEWSL